MKDAFTRPLTLTALMLALGLLGDGLLRAFPWGLNVTIWITALIAAAVYMARVSKTALPPGAWVLLATAWLFSLGFTLWDAPHLRTFDALAVLGCLGMALGTLGAPAYWHATLTQVLARAMFLPLHALIGMHHLGTAVNEAAQREDTGRLVRRVLFGLVLAAPFLVVFTTLFSLADATMESFLRNFWDNVARLEPLSHAGWTAALALAAAAVLVHCVRPVKLSETPPPETWPAGARVVEATAALAVIDLLFLIFVVLQLHYLFGRDAAVQHTANLSYADYAKRGFFELLVVAGVTLAELLFLQLLVAGATARQKRAFHVAAGLQVLLTLLVLASAVHRLALYVEAYGLTVSRVYGLAGLLWVGILLTWLGYTSLRDQRDHFFIGGAWAAIVLLLALNVQSPDAVVARVNLARADATGKIDENYLARLGAEALPLIARHYGEANLPEPVSQKWEQDRMRHARNGLRSFNLSRWRAYR